MLAKTYIVYCSFDNPSDDSRHRHFEYLIKAQSADEAEAKCKVIFAKLPTDGEKLFEPGTKVFVDYIVEVSDVPAEGVVLRYVSYRGELSSASSSLPFGDGNGQLTTYYTDDPEEMEKGIEPQPIAIVG